MLIKFPVTIWHHPGQISFLNKDDYICPRQDLHFVSYKTFFSDKATSSTLLGVTLIAVYAWLSFVPQRSILCIHLISRHCICNPLYDNTVYPHKYVHGCVYITVLANFVMFCFNIYWHDIQQITQRFTYFVDQYARCHCIMGIKYMVAICILARYFNSKWTRIIK